MTTRRKFTEKDTEIIRILSEQGYSQQSIAHQFGVSQGLISKMLHASIITEYAPIVERDTWHWWTTHYLCGCETLKPSCTLHDDSERLIFSSLICPTCQGKANKIQPTPDHYPYERKKHYHTEQADRAEKLFNSTGP